MCMRVVRNACWLCSRVVGLRSRPRASSLNDRLSHGGLQGQQAFSPPPPHPPPGVTRRTLEQLMTGDGVQRGRTGGECLIHPGGGGSDLLQSATKRHPGRVHCAPCCSVRVVVGQCKRPKGGGGGRGGPAQRGAPAPGALRRPLPPDGPPPGGRVGTHPMVEAALGTPRGRKIHHKQKTQKNECFRNGAKFKRDGSKRKTMSPKYCNRSVCFEVTPLRLKISCNKNRHTIT